MGDNDFPLLHYMLPVLAGLATHLHTCRMVFLGSVNSTLARFYPRQESKGKISETDVVYHSSNFISC